MAIARSHSSLAVSLIALAGSALTVFALVGCAPEREPLPLPNASETQSSSPSPGQSETPSSNEAGTPIDLTCDELITPQAMYDFNSNFGIDDEYVPADGSPAAEILDLNGLACSWVNQTSSETIAVAVANLPPDKLATIKSDISATSAAVSNFDAEGYFSNEAGVGRVDVFSGSFWVTLGSTFFTEADDATPLVTAALNAIVR
jgi:hypothetical protein